MASDNVTISLNTARLKTIAICVLVVAAVAAGVWGYRFATARLALLRGEDFLLSGYGALAVEELKPYRRRLAINERGCRALLRAYSLDEDNSGLRWTIEACMNAKLDFYELTIALAEMQESKGQFMAALHAADTTRSANRPETYVLMAKLLARMKNENGFLAILREGVQKFPHETRFCATALNEFLRRKMFVEAKAAADAVRSSPDFLQMDAGIRQAVTMALQHDASQDDTPKAAPQLQQHLPAPQSEER